MNRLDRNVDPNVIAARHSAVLHRAIPLHTQIEPVYGRAVGDAESLGALPCALQVE
jgi:hypothetical protein